MANVFSKLGGFLGQLAPTIATALGGPLAGSAVAALTKALGLPAGTDPKTVEDHILQSTDPATYAAIKKADQDYAIQLKQLGLDAEKIAEQDRASARQREVSVKDKTPRNLAYISVLAFWSYSAMAIIIYIWGARTLSEAVLAIVVGFIQTVLGYAIGENKQVFTYYFGSSAGSDKKTDVIASLTGGSSATTN